MMPEKNPGWNIRDRRRFVVRQERFKMERQGLVEEGQQVEVTERSPNTNLFTYVVEPAVAMSGIYKTSERIHEKQGVIKEIQHTDEDTI